MVEAKPNGNPENRIDCVAVRRVYSSAVAGRKMLVQERNISDRRSTTGVLGFDLIKIPTTTVAMMGFGFGLKEERNNILSYVVSYDLLHAYLRMF